MSMLDAAMQGFLHPLSPLFYATFLFFPPAFVGCAIGAVVRHRWLVLAITTAMPLAVILIPCFAMLGPIRSQPPTWAILLIVAGPRLATGWIMGFAIGAIFHEALDRLIDLLIAPWRRMVARRRLQID